MKKNTLKKAALLGLASGIMFVATGCDTNSEHKAGKDKEANDQKKLTENELVDQLNPETKRLYSALDPQGKELALKLANQTCKGKNSCKGLNACKTAENSCAGQGGCAGKSPRAFTDKNEAVKVAAKHMAEKRNGILNR